MTEITAEEKQKIRLGVEAFFKRLNIGKIALWLIIFLPVWEMIYLYRAAH